MDKKFLMGVADWLTRSSVAAERSTHVSPRLRHNLVKVAIIKSFDFYSGFFETPVSDVDFDKLATDYEHHYREAISLGLFATGGIKEKDHLNFWCLGRVFAPEVYVESGVFIGSSLHAFMTSHALKKVFAIDPNLGELKIPRKNIPAAELIDDRDFSQIEFPISGVRALVYFDDHIDTARRIIQASHKGFRYLLFDDSTGLEGICQRLYPALPTIPIIMNAEILRPGDELAWTFCRTKKSDSKSLLKSILDSKGRMEDTRVNLTVSQELIDECFEARRLIKKCQLIPNLGELIPPQQPGPTLDTGKYLVELQRG